MSGSDRKSLVLRIDPQLHEAIRSLAEAELRSVNAQIEFLLREALKARVRAPRLPPPAPEEPG